MKDKLATVPREQWRAPTAARVARLREKLRDVYGVPLAPPHQDPLAELVLTVLSQSTNDRNRDVAFLRLRERFDTWDAVRDAPVPEVEEAIRPGGISKVKSQRIHDILVAIEATGRSHTRSTSASPTHRVRIRRHTVLARPRSRIERGRHPAGLHRSDTTSIWTDG